MQYAILDAKNQVVEIVETGAQAKESADKYNYGRAIALTHEGQFKIGQTVNRNAARIQSYYHNSGSIIF